MKKVFIITGESSGELYGALLARALRSMYRDVRIWGVGGERMASEGVELIAGVTGSFGLTEAVSSMRSLHDTYGKVVGMIKGEKPQVVVLLDFPEFNMRVAGKARALGARVLYYVSPQVWAWRKGRAERIRELADRIAVVLPFEEEIYRRIGADCEFVGHPIMDEIEGRETGRTSVRRSLGMEPEGTVLGLLPGSRPQELKRLVPLFTAVVRRFRERRPELSYILPLAPNLPDYRRWAGAFEELGVRVLKGMATEALAASDLALIASGTSTLQAALIGTPMVVVYKLFPLTYLIARLIVGVRYISLVNLLMEKEVVRELIQGDATAEKVTKELERILGEEGIRREMTESFRAIRSLYEGKGASRRVAEMVGELAGWEG